MHLEAMGARIATMKSLTFLSNTVARNWLGKYRWRILDAKNQVATDTRDLGAHLNTHEGRKKGTTLTQSMRETAAGTRRLEYCNAPF